MVDAAAIVAPSIPRNSITVTSNGVTVAFWATLTDAPPGMECDPKGQTTCVASPGETGKKQSGKVVGDAIETIATTIATTATTPVTPRITLRKLRTRVCSR